MPKPDGQGLCVWDERHLIYSKRRPPRLAMWCWTTNKSESCPFSVSIKRHDMIHDMHLVNTKYHGRCFVVLLSQRRTLHQWPFAWIRCHSVQDQTLPLTDLGFE